METQFARIPGGMAQAPGQNGPPVATGPKSQAVQAAATDKRSQGVGAWLLRTFPLP